MDQNNDFRRQAERLRWALENQPEVLRTSPSKLSPEARARIHCALRDATNLRG
jgi:hypothetical protein